MALFGLLRRKPFERTGFELYGGAVAAARDPALYAVLGVPDSIPGRFELISLHVALLIRRLRQEDAPLQPGTGQPGRGAAVSQAVFDAMFADMDLNLREMGIGDMSVGKRVKALWEAFHGRAHAYEGPLAVPDAAALAEALARNVWKEAVRADAPGPEGLARLAIAQAGALSALPFESFLGGRAGFLASGALLTGR